MVPRVFTEEADPVEFCADHLPSVIVTTVIRPGKGDEVVVLRVVLASGRIEPEDAPEALDPLATHGGAR